MPVTVSLSNDGTHIVGKIIGDLTLTMVRQGFAEVAALMTATGVTKVLFDTRQQAAPFNTIDGYEAAQIAAQPVFRKTRFAVVVSPGSLRTQHFIELVALNRGVQGRYFDDYDQALAWLGVAHDKE